MENERTPLVVWRWVPLHPLKLLARCSPAETCDSPFLHGKAQSWPLAATQSRIQCNPPLRNTPQHLRLPTPTWSIESFRPRATASIEKWTLCNGRNRGNLAIYWLQLLTCHSVQNGSFLNHWQQQDQGPNSSLRSCSSTHCPHSGRQHRGSTTQAPEQWHRGSQGWVQTATILMEMQCKILVYRWWRSCFLSPAHPRRSPGRFEPPWLLWLGCWWGSWHGSRIGRIACSKEMRTGSRKWGTCIWWTTGFGSVHPTRSCRGWNRCWSWRPQWQNSSL